MEHTPPTDQPQNLGDAIADLIKRRILPRGAELGAHLDPSHEGTVTASLIRRMIDAEKRAAGAQATIDELAERYVEAEWHRTEAEREADTLRTMVDYGRHKLITRDDTPPEGDVALLDITNGRVWVRRHWGGGTVDPSLWVHANQPTPAMGYGWPIEDAGPFIVCESDWHALYDARILANTVEQMRVARRALEGQIGARGKVPPYTASLAEVAQAVRDHHRAWIRELEEKAAVKARQDAETIAMLERQLDELRAALHDDVKAHGKAAAAVLRSLAEDFESGGISHDDLAEGDPATGTRWGDATVADAYDSGGVWVDLLRRTATETEAGAHDHTLRLNL